MVAQPEEDAGDAMRQQSGLPAAVRRRRRPRDRHRDHARLAAGRGRVKIGDGDQRPGGRRGGDVHVRVMKGKTRADRPDDRRRRPRRQCKHLDHDDKRRHAGSGQDPCCRRQIKGTTDPQVRIIIHKKIPETFPCFRNFYYICAMKVIDIIRGARRTAAGRRIILTQAGGIPAVPIRIPEWCSLTRPAAAVRDSAPVYECAVLYDENGADSARRSVSPRVCVRCRFCRFYNVYNIVASRRMWENDFYGRNVRLPAGAAYKPVSAVMVRFGRMWRRGMKKFQQANDIK